MRVQAGVSGRKLDNVPADAKLELETFVGKDGRCSAIRAQEIAEKAKATRELNRQAAAASSAAAPISDFETPIAELVMTEDVRHDLEEGCNLGQVYRVREASG